MEKGENNAYYSCPKITLIFVKNNNYRSRNIDTPLPLLNVKWSVIKYAIYLMQAKLLLCTSSKNNLINWYCLWFKQRKRRGRIFDCY